MMASEQPPPAVLSMKQELELTVPAKGRGFAIPDSEWEFLRQRVRKIQGPATVFQTVASAALGVAGSAFVAAVTLPHDVMVSEVPARLLCWGLTLLFGAVGVLSLVFSSRQKQVVACSREDVLEEMDRIEQRVRPGACKQTN